MRTTIDAAGRVVVPKAIRDAAHLKPGTELIARLVGGHIELEPAPVPVSLERLGGLLVAVPQQPQEPLTHATVEAIRESLRAERNRS
ncbi:MAG: AbrB/MazE/SpoVT family DNA-binding domain-containing protein [Deinococcus sp.]|nr:AbrB/MazE/SpoVT family DNA-binding domain-containing protein [Deinococcus sp.]